MRARVSNTFKLLADLGDAEAKFCHLMRFYGGNLADKMGWLGPPTFEKSWIHHYSEEH